MTVRTTLTLEDDVAERLQETARRRGIPLKRVVNEALRAGLAGGGAPEDEPFTVDPRPMGLRDGLDLDDIEGLLDQIEGPDRR